MGCPDFGPDPLAPRNDGGESRCDGAYRGFEPSGMPRHRNPLPAPRGEGAGLTE